MANIIDAALSNIRSAANNLFGGIRNATQAVGNEFHQLPSQLNNIQQQAISDIGNPVRQTIQSAANQLPSRITQGVNTVGQTIGQQPLLSQPIFHLPSITLNSPTLAQTSQAISPISPATNFLTGQTQKIIPQFKTDMASYSQPMLAGSNATPDEQAQARSNFKNIAMGSVNVGGFEQPAFAKAAKYLIKTADQPAIQKIRDFVADVQQTGGRKNYGSLGQEIQGMATDVFGQNARNLTNTNWRFRKRIHWYSWRRG